MDTTYSNIIVKVINNGPIPISIRKREDTLKTDVVAKQYFKEEIRLDTEYPVLIVPEGECEEIEGSLRFFCKIEEETVQDVEGHVCLRLKILWSDLESTIFDTLLRRYSFKIPQKDREEQYEQFCKRADAYFDVVTSKPAVPIPKNFGSGECNKQIEGKMLSQMLRRYKGICIGEMHLYKSPKAFLIDHMGLLFQLGVRVLYFEGFFVEYQEELEAYNRAPIDSPFPPIIGARLESIDKGQYQIGNVTYSAVMKAAHEVGIDIVGIDTGRAYFYPKKEGKCADYRVIGMNYDAYRMIEEDQKRRCRGSKYVIFGGAAHMLNYGISSNVPGLAQLLQIPAFEIQDSLEDFDRSTIAFGKKASFLSEDQVHVHIKRALMQDISTFSSTEKKAWDLYKEEAVRDKKDIPEEERKKRIEKIESILIDLYKIKSTLLVKDLLAHQMSFLKNQKEYEEFLKKLQEGGYWYSSQSGCVELYNVPFAKRICQELNRQAPEGIRFNSQKLSGFISGGACSAIIFSFLSEHLLLEKGKTTHSTEESIDFIFHQGINYENCDRRMYDARAIQAALNTIEKTEGFCNDFLEAKIVAMLNLFGLRIVKSSYPIDLGARSAQEIFRREMKLLPNGVFFLRTVLPTDNEKREIHGHSMALIKKDEGHFFYDPNNGVEKIEKSSIGTLYKQIFEVHLSFNTPILRIYQIAGRGEKVPIAPQLPVEFQKNDTHFSTEELRALSPEARFLYLRHPKAVRELKEGGISFKEFASFHTSNIPAILRNTRNVLSLREDKELFAQLEKPIPSQLLAKLFRNTSFIKDLRNTGIDWERCVRTRCFEVASSHYSTHSLITLHEGGIEFEELDAFSEEQIVKVFAKALAIVELKREGIDWKRCVQTRCFEVASSHYSTHSLVTLHEGGIEFEELEAFSEEQIEKIFANALAIVELKKEGIDWKRCVQTRCFEMASSYHYPTYSLITLHKGGIEFEELEAFSEEQIERVFANALSVVELERAGIDWKRCVQTRCFEMASSYNYPTYSLITLYRGGIEFEELDSFSDETIITILKNSIVISFGNFSETECAELEEMIEGIKALKRISSPKAFMLHREDYHLWNKICKENEERVVEFLRYPENLVKLYRRGFSWEKIVSLPPQTMGGYIRNADLLLKIVEEYNVSIEDVLECDYDNFILLNDSYLYSNLKKYNVGFLPIRNLRYYRLEKMLQRGPSELDEHFSFQELSKVKEDILEVFDERVGVVKLFMDQGLSRKEIKTLLEMTSADLLAPFLDEKIKQLS